jgi:predicted negative regulator of RcsB-dependent stress response
VAEYLSDEEQVERLKRLAKTYGSSALTGVLLALTAYFGWSYWQKTQQAEQFNAVAQYQKVLEAQTTASQTPDDQAARTKFLSEASSLVKANPDSVVSFYTLLLEAKAATDRNDYAAAEKALIKAGTFNIDDQGLKQIAQLRLARTQLELNKLDVALVSLKAVNRVEFAPSAQELRGDILLRKNDQKGAQQAYQAAWDSLSKRPESRELLKTKMQSIGMTVNDIDVPTPIKEAT